MRVIALEQKSKGEKGAVEKKEKIELEITVNILKIIEFHTAGSPTDSRVKWTNLTVKNIVEKYFKGYGVKLSKGCVKRVLRSQNYRNRKPNKSICTGKSPDRAEQFKIIVMLVALFEASQNNPIISIDTKKKETLGNFTRNESILCKESPCVFDHDYPSLGTGKVIPQGVFDVKLNKGYVTIGDSHDTAEFIVENLLWWWEDFGIHNYPDAKQILVLCDGGGGNGSRHYAFKYELLRLAQLTGKQWLIAHYPPYCSKWNPIEHRFFCHLHRSIKGVILTSHEQVAQLMENTVAKSKNGTDLTTEVRIVKKTYVTERNIKSENLDYRRIIAHPDLPRFSYLIKP